MYKCKTCDREFERRHQYNGHCIVHSTKSKEFRKKKRKSSVNVQIEKIHECKFCGKEFEKGIQLGGHVACCKLNPNYTFRIKKISEKSKTQIWTDGRRKCMSDIAKKLGLGGHTSKFRLKYLTKSGEIVNLQSSYEIRVAEDLDNSNIEWIRPEPLNWIDSNGEEHRYYADFYLPKYKIYLDPKNNYLQTKDKEKIELVQKQNNVRVFMLSENELNWNSIKSLM